MGETTLNKRMKEYCLKAEIKSINFHMFRHTEATLLNDEGIYSKTIAKYLGHVSDDITKKYYIHKTDNQRETVADLLDKIFSNYL